MKTRWQARFHRAGARFPAWSRFPTRVRQKVFRRFPGFGIRPLHSNEPLDRNGPPTSCGVDMGDLVEDKAIDNQVSFFFVETLKLDFGDTRHHPGLGGRVFRQLLNPVCGKFDLDSSVCRIKSPLAPFQVCQRENRH